MSVDIEIEVLPEDVQEKAALELGECIQERSLAIENFRKMLLQDNLHGCLSDGFLLRFLRAHKFKLPEACQSYRNYYEIRQLYPEVFAHLQPSFVQHVFSDCVVARLAIPNEVGCPVLYFRPGAWNPDTWPVTDVFRANVVLVEELLLRWPSVQVHGVVILVDLTGFTWLHCIHMMSPSFIRRTARFMQGSTPVRVKAIHVYNEPKLISRLYTLLRILLKPKMLGRIKFHGTRLSDIHSVLPPHLLPENVGLKGTGCAIPYNDYMEDLLRLDNFFLRMSQVPILSPKLPTVKSTMKTNVLKSPQPQSNSSVVL